MLKTNRIVAFLAAGVLASVHFAGSSSAAAPSEEVIVTAQKYQDYDEFKLPYVHTIKRADFLVTHVDVICDTRDLKQREEELRTTLRSLITAADGPSGITLGVGDDIVAPFTADTIERVILPDQKEETSHAIVIVKTQIQPDDTFDKAANRIKAFIDKTPKAGRTEILQKDKWDLTIVGPERYRDELLQLIADDAKKTAATIGPNLGVEIDNLQHIIEWHQTGQLDLSLDIPYQLKLIPLR